MVVKEHLNALPVKTYRWLKVNELTLSEPLHIPLQPYNKDFLSFTQISGLDAQPILAVALKDRLGVDHSPYGVSGELVSLSETQPNAGVQVYAAPGVKSSEPIVARYQMDRDNPVVNDHNVVFADEGSSVTVVFYYSSIADNTVHNGTLKVYARPGAEVNIVKIQQMDHGAHHFDSTVTYVDQDAKVNFVHVELGAALTAVNYSGQIGDRAELNIHGAYFGDGTQQLDLNYLADHRGVGSISNIFVHGALKDRAKKIFRGTIDLKRGARQSKGSEIESVLLLDETVRSIAVPLLLAGEDDVEGEHAATSGKVDEEKIHYLMTRGLSRGQATQLLVEAAFQPVIDALPGKEWKSAVTADLERRLSDGV